MNIDKTEILRLLKEGKPEAASKYAYGAREVVYRKDGPVDLSDEYTLYGYKGTQSVVIIPSRIGKKLVTAVGVPNIWKNYTQTVFWDVDTVIISEGIRELNRFAFSIVNTLKHIYLPDTLEYVADDALLYNTDTTIYCSKSNILAQEVAEKHSFKCVVLDV